MKTGLTTGNIPLANNRLKRLITGAQIFSVFCFLGILVAFSWTARHVAAKRGSTLSDQPESVTESVTADTTPYDAPVSNNSSKDKNVYVQIEMQKSINQSLYTTVKNNTPDSTSDKSERFTVLYNMQLESNKMCDRIEHLYQGFMDTLNLIGSTDAGFSSEHYFVESGRDSKLRKELLTYRNELISSLNDLEIGNVDELKESLPMDEISGSQYVVAWDWEKFSDKPSTTLSYLRQLELEVRNFEAAALNKFPQTVTTY